MIIIYYIFLVIPVWIAFRFTTNYSVLIGCRNFLKYSFVVLCILYLAPIVMGKAFFDKSALTAYETGSKTGEALIVLLIPLLWNIWMALCGLKFYGSTHIENLKYFVLYLRSFKDDKKKTIKEYMLMRALYSFFCPFAIGRPNEISSSNLSAIKLYVDDDWKENVLDMMEKAPIILLRVSDTSHFFWEFEQCVVNKHIDKSLFWVSDIDSYSRFCTKATKQYSIEFPPVDNITDNSVIFKDGDVFSVIKLDIQNSYKEFVQAYNKSRNLVSNYYDYFSGRNTGLTKQFFTWKRDLHMMDGIQEWCWTAFLFPEFYIIFQRFPNRGWMYILSYLLFILFFIPMLLVRPLFMAYMGRNGKKMVWLSEKWESLEYFEEIHQKNNIKVIGFAACIIIYVISIFL